MWKLHRYYLREVAGTSVLTFLVLFGIVLVASVSRGIDEAQGGNLMSAALITFLWAADTFPHLLTISLLVATVLTFARASQDREITAIRAAGISPRVPMVSAMIVGLFFSIAGSFAHHQLIPMAHYHKYRVISQAVKNLLFNAKVSGGKIAVGGFFLTSLRKDDRRHLHDVVILLGKEQANQVTARGFEAGTPILADEAWLDVGADGETLTLNLLNARDTSGTFKGTGVVTISVNIRNLVGGPRNEGDKDLSSHQLLAEVDRGIHSNPGAALFTVHRRACFALMPFLLAPIGFCIGVMSRERGRMTAVLLAMVPLFLFYGCVLAAGTLIRIVDFPPIAWLPAVVLGALGIPFCWRLLRL